MGTSDMEQTCPPAIRERGIRLPFWRNLRLGNRQIGCHGPPGPVESQGTYPAGSPGEVPGSHLRGFSIVAELSSGRGKEGLGEGPRCR